MKYKIIGIIFEKNTLELFRNNKRYYYKLSSDVNALKSYKTGDDIFIEENK